MVKALEDQTNLNLPPYLPLLLSHAPTVPPVRANIFSFPAAISSLSLLSLTHCHHPNPLVYSMIMFPVSHPCKPIPFHSQLRSPLSLTVINQIHSCIPWSHPDVTYRTFYKESRLVASESRSSVGHRSMDRAIAGEGSGRSCIMHSFLHSFMRTHPPTTRPEQSRAAQHWFNLASSCQASSQTHTDSQTNRQAEQSSRGTTGRQLPNTGCGESGRGRGKTSQQAQGETGWFRSGPPSDYCGT